MQSIWRQGNLQFSLLFFWISVPCQVFIAKLTALILYSGPPWCSRRTCLWASLAVCLFFHVYFFMICVVVLRLVWIPFYLIFSISLYQCNSVIVAYKLRHCICLTCCKWFSCHCVLHQNVFLISNSEICWLINTNCV